ncbi:MAG: hypothetical protein M9921_11170 [Fimbriimonadaceae bacterium]|nr:hypothetical protein [Fimbriimonadaceae bacterium]
MYVTVLESGDKKATENPGGAKLMADLGGDKAGLPFTAMLDADGKMILNSIRPGEKGGNIGHPMEPEEIAHFMEMVRKGAPRATKAELDKLEAFLKAQKRGGLR